MFLLQNPVFALTPGVCVAVLVICLNMLGDGVRDALDPRLRGELIGGHQDGTFVGDKNIETCFKTDGQLVKAVDGVSMYLNPGEIIGIVGESGSGKSVTMMSMLQLITSPERSRAARSTLKGNDRNMLEYGDDSEEMRRMRGGKVSMIFQEPMTSLNPVLTIGYQIQENIMEHLHVSKEEAKKRTIEMLKLVNIPDAEQTF